MTLATIFIVSKHGSHFAHCFKITFILFIDNFIFQYSLLIWHMFMFGINIKT